MNDRIDWGEGSFEFVTNEELENIKIKKYPSISQAEIINQNGTEKYKDENAVERVDRRK